MVEVTCAEGRWGREVLRTPIAQLSGPSIWLLPTPNPIDSNGDSSAPPRAAPSQAGAEAIQAAAPLPLNALGLYIALPLPLLIG